MATDNCHPCSIHQLPNIRHPISEMSLQRANRIRLSCVWSTTRGGFPIQRRFQLCFLAQPLFSSTHSHYHRLGDCFPIQERQELSRQESMVLHYFGRACNLDDSMDNCPQSARMERLCGSTIDLINRAAPRKIVNKFAFPFGIH